MISLVYACMDREINLIESINSWLNVPEITEIIVIDWSSNKPLLSNPQIKLWIKHKKIKLVRVIDETYFSLARAYNLAFKMTNNKIILKCDSDYKNINSTWLKNLVIQDDELLNYFIVGHWMFAKSLNGFLLVNKKHFQPYNENFNGWGYDDTDCYQRIQDTHKHIQKIIFFNIKDYIYHIPHTEEARTQNYEIKDKLLSNKINVSMRHNKFRLSEYHTLVDIGNYLVLKRKLI